MFSIITPQVSHKSSEIILKADLLLKKCFSFEVSLNMKFKRTAFIYNRSKIIKVSFDQLNASLLDRSISFFEKKQKQSTNLKPLISTLCGYQMF